MASTYADELRAAATGLRTSIATHLKPSDAVQLDALLSSVAQFGRAWSGSNLGFHSCVYYQDFAPPPAGAHFSSEWGFNGMFQGTTGNWEEHDRNDVTSAILHRAGDVDLDAINVRVEKIRKDFTDEQATIVSILSAFQQFTPDEYVAKLHDKAETIKVATTARLAHAARSRFAGAQIMSRDAVAIGQGFTLSPHEMVSIEVHALTRPTEQSDELATLAERAGRSY